MTTIRTILHPTDFSSDSEYAFQLACSLARDHDARIVMLHVLYPSSAPLCDGPAPNPLRSAESQESIVGSYPWPLPKDPAIRIEHRVAEGDPVMEILRVAKSLECDLIVMGTHGRTGIKRLLAGSVAEGTLRGAACPVLTVRLPLAAPDVTAPPGPAQAGEVVNVDSAANATVHAQPLFQVDGAEILSRYVSSGDELPDPGIDRQLLVHCLSGHVTCSMSGKAKEMRQGDLLLLPAHQPRRVRAVDDSSLLLTISRAKH
jgi:nucleotide-binding universal stress UspA family protein/quercetin dioxygenase-like cupin family protein